MIDRSLPPEEARLINRLQELVPGFLKQTPLYRHVASKDLAQLSPSDFFSSFSSLPLISKSDIRLNFPDNFLTSSAGLDPLIDSGQIELEQTSGTSEEPTPLLLPKGWWAVQERENLCLNPLVGQLLRQDSRMRRAVLASPSCNHDISYRGVPPRSQRILGTALHANLMKHPFIWPDTELERIANEIVEWTPVFLDVDPAYGVSLARYCLRHGIKFPSLRFILASYEYVSAIHRELLTRVFQVPVFNLYGSTETGHLLMEDHQGLMRVSQSTAFLEVIDADADGIGRLIITTLDNPYMPLIRYDIGDLVRILPAESGSVWEIHGRCQDCLTDTRGRRITVRQVDLAMAGAPGVLHYQLRQRSATQFQLLLIPVNPDDPGDISSDLKNRLGDLLGTQNGLAVEWIDFLLSESSGKFRLCIQQK